MTTPRMPPATPRQMSRILVFGGTGFLGQHCVAALRRSGDFYAVASASRSPSADLACDLCRGPEESLHRALLWKSDDDSGGDGGSGAVDVVVNLVGIKRPTADQGWYDAHVSSVRRLLAAMRKVGARRLVHVTVAGLSSGQADPYSATKMASEEAIHEAVELCRESEDGGLSAYIVRPAVVWGRGDDFSRNLAAGILHAPVFPTPYPSGRIAAIHVEDVADAVVAVASEILREAPPKGGAAAAAESSKKGGGGGFVRCVDVCGPEKLTLPELIARTSEAVGLSCVSLPVPAPLMVPAAWIVERLLSDPPITAAQLCLLRRGVTGDLDQTTTLLGRVPRRYTSDGVREAVEGARPLFGVSIRWLLGQEVRPLLGSHDS